MGLFRKKTKGTSGPVVDFLNKVDDAYTEVFISKSIAPRQPYATHDVLSSVCRHYNINMDTPFENLSPDEQNIILYGHSKKSRN